MQNALVLPNSSGAIFRTNANNALQTLARGNDGTSAPSTTYPELVWHDTTNNVVKKRNLADSAWVIVGTLDAIDLGALFNSIAAKAANYTVVAADMGVFFLCTGAFTLTLAAPGTLGSRFRCAVRNAGTGVVTVSPASGNIDGAATLIMNPGDTCIIACDGSNFYTAGLSRKGWYAGPSAPPNPVANQPWIDTTNGLIKQYNNAANAWVVKGTMDAPMWGALLAQAVAKLANYSVVDADNGTVFKTTGTWTLTLPQASTLKVGNGFKVAVDNGPGAGVITITPTTSTIDGAASLTLAAGDKCIIYTDGTNYFTAARYIASPSPGSNSVGTGQLKSSTGSASGSIGNGGTVEVAMNDYSFFPNANIASGSTNTPVNMILANTSTTSAVGTFALYNNSGVGTNYTVNWRYITATDNPIVYLLLSGNTILVVWAADDPPPNGVTGLNVSQGVLGQRVVTVTPAMLDVSAAPASAIGAAQAWIAQQGYKIQNSNYRIVQQWANGDCTAAPAQWLLQHGTWDEVAQLLRLA